MTFTAIGISFPTIGMPVKNCKRLGWDPSCCKTPHPAADVKVPIGGSVLLRVTTGFVEGLARKISAKSGELEKL